MKRKMMLFGVALILGLLALGCDSGGGGGGGAGGGGALDGMMYNGDGNLAFFTGGLYEIGDIDRGSRGTYTISDNTIYFTESQKVQDHDWVESEGASYTGTISGNTITVEAWGEVLTFEKTSGRTDGGKGTGGGGALDGDYFGEGRNLAFFTGGLYEMVIYEGGGSRGTYTVSNNTISFTQEKVRVSSADDTWETQPGNYTGTISGNTITVSEWGVFTGRTIQ